MKNEITTLPEQHSLPLSIFLHLLPGILTGTTFFLIAPFVQRNNLPPFMALCLADLVVLLPLIFGYLFYQGYKRNGQLSLEGVILYREKVRTWEYFVFVPVVFFASGLLIVALSSVGNSILNSIFAWWPAMFNLAADLSPYSRSALIFSYIVNFVMVSLAAPITEEIYFRGYLLPRLSRYGLWALSINSILFALFHIWTPWMAVARAVGLIPLIYAAQKKQNIYIGMLAHILVNSLDVATGVMFILKQK